MAGSVTGNNDVAGIVNKIDEDGKIENVAFLGKINSVGNNSTVGGIAGSNYMGFVNRAYVDATITAQNANASMLVPFVTYMLNSWKSGTKAKVTNSVAKGVLDVKNTRNVGGIVAKTWPYGAVQNNVTYAKVIKGQEILLRMMSMMKMVVLISKTSLVLLVIARPKMVLVKILRVRISSNI
ncbi:MAG: hypothetical protein ACLS6Y_07805 [Streptococcus salivarius]